MWSLCNLGTSAVKCAAGFTSKVVKGTAHMGASVVTGVASGVTKTASAAKNKVMGRFSVQNALPIDAEIKLGGLPNDETTEWVSVAKGALFMSHPFVPCPIGFCVYVKTGKCRFYKRVCQGCTSGFLYTISFDKEKSDFKKLAPDQTWDDVDQNFISSTADGIPVVGQFKAGYHYVKGETDAAKRAGRKSMRNTAVLGAGIGVIATGGALAVPLACGSTVVVGAAADEIDNRLEDRDEGVLREIRKGNYKNATIGVACDALSGFGASGVTSVSVFAKSTAEGTVVSAIDEITGLPVGLVMTANGAAHSKNTADALTGATALVCEAEQRRMDLKAEESEENTIRKRLMELINAKQAGKMSEQSFTIGKRGLLFERLDLDGDGVITAAELAKATPEDRKEIMALDLDGDGEITLDELNKANEQLADLDIQEDLDIPSAQAARSSDQCKDFENFDEVGNCATKQTRTTV